MILIYYALTISQKVNVICIYLKTLFFSLHLRVFKNVLKIVSPGKFPAIAIHKTKMHTVRIVFLSPIVSGLERNEKNKERGTFNILYCKVSYTR